MEISKIYTVESVSGQDGYCVYGSFTNKDKAIKFVEDKVIKLFVNAQYQRNDSVLEEKNDILGSYKEVARWDELFEDFEWEDCHGHTMGDCRRGKSLGFKSSEWSWLRVSERELK